MKVTRVLAFIIMSVAILMTGVGGMMDSWKGDGMLRITSHHAWNDGLFLAVLAVFLLLL